MTADIERELERVAMREPASGREALAKVTALRTLEKLRRPRGGQLPPEVERLFDETRDPDELVRSDDWHATGGVMQGLDCYDTVEERRRHYLALRDEGMLPMQAHSRNLRDRWSLFPHGRFERRNGTIQLG